MFLRTVLRNTGAMARKSFRPAVIRQIPRRNFMVGLQPGIEEQLITHEAQT